MILPENIRIVKQNMNIPSLTAPNHYEGNEKVLGQDLGEDKIQNVKSASGAPFAQRGFASPEGAMKS